MFNTLTSIKEILIDTLIDSIKLLPFLFFTYLFMEYIEHKTSNKVRDFIEKSGKFGPVIGGIVGIQFILMESGLAASIIKQHNDLQTQKQYHSYEKNLFILFLHASSPLESCFSVMPNAPCVPALVPFRTKEDRFYSSLSGKDSS